MRGHKGPAWRWLLILTLSFAAVGASFFGVPIVSLQGI